MNHCQVLLRPPSTTPPRPSYRGRVRTSPSSLHFLSQGLSSGGRPPSSGRSPLRGGSGRPGPARSGPRRVCHRVDQSTGGLGRPGGALHPPRGGMRKPHHSSSYPPRQGSPRRNRRKQWVGSHRWPSPTLGTHQRGCPTGKNRPLQPLRHCWCRRRGCSGPTSNCSGRGPCCFQCQQ